MIVLLVCPQASNSTSSYPEVLYKKPPASSFIKKRLQHRSFAQRQLPEVFYIKAVHKSFAILTGKHICWILFLIKSCSDERQNGFKSLKLKCCKFLQPSFTPCEHDCFCLKTLKHFRFKCLRRFLKINFFDFLKPF